MDHFIDTKIPKLAIFVDKNSQNDQTPFPKVGRKTPVVYVLYNMWLFICDNQYRRELWN